MTNDPAQMMPFLELIGIDVVAAGQEHAVATLAWAPERCTTGGVMHGGALMSLADAVGGLVAFHNLPPGAAGTTTTSSATQFTSGLRNGTAIATARPLHRGRTTIVVETNIEDEHGRLLARVTQTQMVLSP